MILPMLKVTHFKKLHPLAYQLLRAAVIACGLLLAVVLYVALVGITIDASGQRGRLAAKLTQALGREVRFEGAMQLEVSAHPRLKVGGMHIANAAGFSGGDFVSLGEARLALDLWPLLRLRFQVEELSGSGVQIRLQLKKDGSNNWTFTSATAKQAELPAEDASTIGLSRVLARLDIKRVSLDNLAVEFIGANEKRHSFELQSLLAQLPAGEPVKLALHGTVEKIHPYQLEFSGGSISDLARSHQPWPIDLKLDFMSSQLLLNGSLSGNTGAINFGLGTQHLAEFEQLLQIPLPPIDVAYLAGAVNYAPGKIALKSIGGHMGKSTLYGALNFDYSGARPRVQGELSLPVLDLRPFMAGKPVADTAPDKGLAEMYRDISNASFSLKALNEMDADVSLQVKEWLSQPALHDAKLQVKLEQGLLMVPMQVSMADVKFNGSVSADASVSPAKFKLALGTTASNMRNLAGQLLGMQGVEGHLGSLDLRIAARGDRGSALMKTLDVQLKVARGKLSYGNGEGEQPVQLTLDKLLLALPAGKHLSGELNGALLDKSFSASLQGPALATLMQEAPAPFDFKLRAGTATANVHALMRASAQQSQSDVSFELAAPHSGEIASWLGLKPGADAPVNMYGKFHADSASWQLADFAMKLGRSDLSADVLHTTKNGKSLIILNIKSDVIDVEQLQSLLPKVKKQAPAATQAAVSMMDIPVLPSGISLADADIAVSLKRIISASPFSVRDVRFDGQIRDGVMPISPFSAKVAENNFTGAMSLDLRTRQPHALIWVAADALDVGSVLKKIGLTSDVEADVDHFALQLDLHSSRLGEMLAQSELLANFEGGHFTLTDASSGGKMRIAVDHGELKSGADAPVYLNLLGSLDQVPVTIGIQTAKAVDLINPKLSLPFELNASTSAATIKLSGDIERPFSKRGLTLALEMKGNRFDNLNALAHIALPPWGPWSAAGNFTVSDGDYEVSGLRLQVGSSELYGFGRLDTKMVPPRLDMMLVAPGIQLDDFKTDEWSLDKANPDTQKKSASKSELRQKAQAASQHAQQILSAEVLRRQNAFLTVQVNQVVSGQDLLGSGKLEARVEKGRAVLGPIAVNTPGGSASFLLNYELGQTDVGVELRVEAKHFDYGILARRLDHNSEMSGVFSLDVDVSARTQYLSDIFKDGKGHVNFEVWPENMKSGLLDVWAVNVLMALLPAVDSSNQSKVNCAVGKFVLADGKLAEKSFLIDTSRMRVTGKGGVDFTQEKINFYVQPRAKTPQFLSVAIPIELSGSFDDFRVGVRAADAVGSVGQLFTSVIWVPLQMLFGKETPADGQDVCGKPAVK